jgi:glycosyltransferase involved in cell wall biosynthesis
MRLLYLYPEEWTGRRAREVHTLSTCLALARHGLEVTLVTGGGRRELQQHLLELAGRTDEPGLRTVVLSRFLGPIRSSTLFLARLRLFLRYEQPFAAAYIIHLKAAAMLRWAEIPFLYEAHEVFAETPQKTPVAHEHLHELEKEVLGTAAWRVATSKALAVALKAHYVLPDDFAIVPNAGLAPVEQSVAGVDGPFVYCGSLSGWKGLELMIEASREAEIPLKIVGGTTAEWQTVSRKLSVAHISWLPRMPLAELPSAFAGARAGLISTQPASPSGRYSCPMKLFDYARCGLPVLSTALPSLRSLDVGSWCMQVTSGTKAEWVETMRQYRYRPVLGETARAWAGVHTWKQRAESLTRLLAQKGSSAVRWK